MKKHFLYLVFLTAISTFLHFYNLNWGAPFYFHPDERNIASSVSQLQFPNQMNPHFFAYGSLPIYVIYFTGYIINLFSNILITKHYALNPSFEQAILISRFYSALLATLLIPIIFSIGKKLKDENTGIIAAFLATTSVGLIQFSHFGTFEIWLTFFSVLFFWVCLKKINNKTVLLMGPTLGVLVSIKISSLVLFLLPLIVIPAQMGIHRFKTKFGIKLLNIVLSILTISLASLIVYLITNPYVFFDYQSFKGSINYESGLALGKFPVFYTGEFFNTIPVLFQFINIYPFLLNILVTIIFIPSLIYLSWKSIKTKNRSYLILNTFYLILFLSQAFLFAKWTRYIVPTLPFIYLIIALTISDVIASVAKQSHKRLPRLLLPLTMTTIIVITSIFAFSYFITAFTKQDTRIAAADFAKNTIPANSQILSEVYDLGIIPFNRYQSNITLFNFYDLDPTSPSGLRGASQFPPELIQNLENSEYIILPSQRILKTRLLNSDKFPKGNKFYEDLLNGKLGFKKIHETPCDIFCNITYLGDPVFRFEQTANVFDRPTIMIFKKNK